MTSTGHRSHFDRLARGLDVESLAAPTYLLPLPGFHILSPRKLRLASAERGDLEASSGLPGRAARPSGGTCAP